MQMTLWFHLLRRKALKEENLEKVRVRTGRERAMGNY
jgi:hypothetical protein